MIGTEVVDILLVEDSPDDAEIALRALKRHKLANSIVHARDGKEALDFLYSRGIFEARGTRANPRLVLLDLKLPKVSGLEVLGQIKGDPALKSIPVVVLTSSKEESDLVETYRLGTNSYLVKPFDFEKFSEAMREVGMYWLLLNQTPSA